MSVRRILLTADTVGGVWTYAVDLAQSLGEVGIEDGAGHDRPAAGRRATGLGSGDRRGSNWSKLTPLWTGSRRTLRR